MRTQTGDAAPGNSEVRLEKALDIRQIGSALGADTVLEGSVRKAGPILRITAQLVDVMSGCIFWSGNYERLLEDVFAVQEEISHAIASALRGQFPATSFTNKVHSDQSD